MTLTRQLRKGAGSGEMGRTCAGLGSGGLASAPSSRQAGCCVQP